MKRLILACALILNLGLLYAQDFNKLDEFFNILDTHEKYMGTMTITKNGQEVFNKAIGFADVKTNTKIANDTKFRIGSITKAFTAVMIFQMIDEGTLTLETTLSKFYPKVPNASKITIANLLNHSSGLYNITNSKNYSTWMYKASTRETMLSRIEKFEVDFQPNEETQYSNTNYILLGYIAETIDKKNYSEILNTRIVDKLGLKNTYYGGNIAIDENESYSYTKGDAIWQKQGETSMANPGGAGAIVSTSKDLTLFFDALFDNKLMSEESFKVMKKTNNEDTCHGLFYAELNGVDVYASQGSIDGFKSMLAHVPETKTTVALTSNGIDYNIIRIALSGIAITNGQQIMLPNFEKIELTEDQAKQYEGEYASDQVPYKLIFKAEGTILKGAPEQSDLKELTPTKQHQFTLDTMSIVLDFYPETGIVRFIQGDNEPLLFKKL